MIKNKKYTIYNNIAIVIILNGIVQELYYSFSGNSG